MHHTHAEIQRQPVHYIQSRDRYGNDCYFVLRASRQNAARLLAQKHGAIDISHFGEILVSGYGHPTDKTRTELEQRYNLTLPA